ncbi:hypothetical protein E2C01_023066 [Portunus trituberculatus]|uniref:Uncharacterized protein n=1 Tax=Portunus trituberculatus TaxID=210409 RepID=A0A5B7E8Z3_PORTR|nr:hypothetical protein [Portunus trituberculatus]
MVTDCGVRGEGSDAHLDLPGLVNATMSATAMMAAKPIETTQHARFWEHTMTAPGSYMARLLTMKPLSLGDPARQQLSG